MPPDQPSPSYIDQTIQEALNRRQTNAAPVPQIQQTMGGAPMGTPSAVAPEAMLAQRAASPQPTKPKAEESPEEVRVVTQLLLKKLSSMLKST